MDFVTLNNGIKMPMLGFGVFQVTDNGTCEKQSAMPSQSVTALSTRHLSMETNGP